MIFAGDIVAKDKNGKFVCVETTTSRCTKCKKFAKFDTCYDDYSIYPVRRSRCCHARPIDTIKHEKEIIGVCVRGAETDTKEITIIVSGVGMCKFSL